MIRNYLKIALRNLAKHKIHSIIMIGGFSVGIAACLLITLFIRNELSYDKHVPDGERIYRFYNEINYQGELLLATSYPSPFAKTVLSDFPEVLSTGRRLPHELFGAGTLPVRRIDQQQNSIEKGFVWADQGLLDTLQIPIIRGDASSALLEPRTIVISESMAKKFFPNSEAVGAQLVVNNDEKNLFRIGGVIAEFPETSHLQDKFFMSLAGAPFGQQETVRWLQNNHETYALLRPGVDAKAFELKLKSIVKKYYKPAFQEERIALPKDIEDIFTIRLQPLYDIHLKSNDFRSQDTSGLGDIRYVWLFATIAIGILLIACINFINLSTAKSATRAKEVGLRKVVGSGRRQLMQQFMSESLMISVFSFVLGLVLAELFLPWFNQISNKQLGIPWLTWQFPSLILVSSLFVGLIAGIYPAFYLSAFKPISVLRGNLSFGNKNGSLRSALVVFQFAACILLIVGTVFVFRQLQYILNRPIGYDREQIVMLKGANNLGDQTGAFKQEALKLHGVNHVTVSGYVPVEGGLRNGNSFTKEGRSSIDPVVSGQSWIVDEDYLDTMGMTLLEGRNFSIEIQADRNAAIINQRMVEKLALNNPIGSRIDRGGNVLTIIGVVEDFNFDSLLSGIKPLCMQLGENRGMISIKINAADVHSTIQSITALWDEFSPNQSIDFQFMDERYANSYGNVQRMVMVLASFTVIAIMIACLGLFALSAFMTEQRSKEISVRRVVGASYLEIFQMLSIGFLKLVFVSFIIAAPLGWYLLNQWLRSYAYRINLSWDVFVFAGIAASLVAILTISYHALRAANRDPVEGLRTE